MGDTEEDMKWLVDTSDVAVSCPQQAPMLMADERTSASEIRIEECGENLVDVSDHLRIYWVYSWLGFSRLPSKLALREGVIARLVSANDSLPAEFELVVIDGWRPRAFQCELLRYYKDTYRVDVRGFVADPEAEAVPPHTTGGAVDLTLAWKGATLGLGTDFDAFTDAAASNAAEGDSCQDPVVRDLRRLLGGVLRQAGLVPYPLEWWHWSYGDQLWAAAQEKCCAIYGELPDL
jgi:D-alanyl-D-alanine dipeptidase